MQLLVLGAGYTVRQAGQRLSQEFDCIVGTTRSRDSASTLADNSIQPLVVEALATPDNRLHPQVAAKISDATHLLMSIGPDGDAARDKWLCEAISAQASRLQWAGYLSSISVYGDHGGDWVDEDSPCNPTARRALDRLEAERYWQNLARTLSIPLTVFRLAGIYGPHRNSLKKLADGKARQILKPGQVFNRIHTADITTAIACCAAEAVDGIFNLSDGQPAPPEKVMAYAAGLLGCPLPSPVAHDDPSLSPMTRSFYADNKRVSNTRSLTVPGMHYQYPSYQSGLKALFDSNSWR